MRTASVIAWVLLLAGVLVADETIMPTGVVSNGGSSWATSDNYALQFSVGQPCVGMATGTTADADAGFWNLLWVAESPPGWINPGWNWISVPTHPQFPAVSVICAVDPTNRLYRWDWLAKNTELYPYDFTTMENTLGYLLLESTGQTLRYSGFLNRTPLDDPDAPDYRATTVYLPNAGAITLGYPHPWPVELAALKVRYGAEVRTALEDRVAAHPWVNWNWIYWDSVADTARICSFSGGDDTMLRPWYYYWIWLYYPPTPLDPNGPYLIIPEPEVEE
jgi:hypothetical protein